MKLTYAWLKEYVGQQSNPIYVTDKGGVYVPYPGAKNKRLNISKFWDRLQKDCRVEIFEKQKGMTVYKCLPADEDEKENTVGEK